MTVTTIGHIGEVTYIPAGSVLVAYTAASARLRSANFARRRLT